MTTTIEVNRRYCGQFEEAHSTDYSISWYCWICGEVYARRTIVSKVVHWDFYYGICLDCAKKDSAIASGGWWQFFRSHNEILHNTEMPSLVLAEEFLFNVELLGVLENGNHTSHTNECRDFDSTRGFKYSGLDSPQLDPWP